MISIFVPGTARTAGSKSAFKNGRGKLHLTHAGKHSKAWMDKVGWYVLQRVNRMILWEGPITLKLVFMRDRPKGHYGQGRNAGKLKPSAPPYPTTKPDLDKLNRAVGDALTGIVWKDDSQVVNLESSKLYCGPKDRPGVHITINQGV